MQIFVEIFLPHDLVERDFGRLIELEFKEVDPIAVGGDGIDASVTGLRLGVHMNAEQKEHKENDGLVIFFLGKLYSVGNLLQE